MRRALLVLATLLIPGTSSADKGLKKAEIDPDGLTYYTDGRGHYLAVDLEQYDKPVMFYSGRGKVFHQQKMKGRSGYPRNPKDRWWSFWSPQSRDPIDQRSWASRSGFDGSLRFRKGEWKLRCGHRETKVFAVDEKKSKQLRRAKYLERKHKRAPYLLARDDRGVYYYADSYQLALGGGNFRLFVGKPGAMKAQRIKQLITDEVGDVFETPTGSLVRNKRKDVTQWRPKKGKAIDVFLLSMRSNDFQIYGQLGIYKQRLGTPCDDL